MGMGHPTVDSAVDPTASMSQSVRQNAHVVMQSLQVTSAINNLIMGKIYIEHTGIMRITNLQSTMVAKIKFKESGRLSSKDAHQVIQSA